MYLIREFDGLNMQGQVSINACELLDGTVFAVKDDLVYDFISCEDDFNALAR